MIDKRRVYFRWLLEYFDISRPRYKKLLKHLFKTEYYYINPMDANRESDGIDIRLEFDNDTGHSFSGDILSYPCSLIEMLIGMSIRIQNIMDDEFESTDVSYWFWDMIDNLGLLDYTDDYFDLDEYEQIVYDFMDKKYTEGTRGNIFIIMDPDFDTKNSELWMQMQKYLNEQEINSEERGYNA